MFALSCLPSHACLITPVPSLVTGQALVKTFRLPELSKYVILFQISDFTAHRCFHTGFDYSSLNRPFQSTHSLNKIQNRRNSPKNEAIESGLFFPACMLIFLVFLSCWLSWRCFPSDACHVTSSFQTDDYPPNTNPLKIEWRRLPCVTVLPIRRWRSGRNLCKLSSARCDLASDIRHHQLLSLITIILNCLLLFLEIIPVDIMRCVLGWLVLLWLGTRMVRFCLLLLHVRLWGEPYHALHMPILFILDRLVLTMQLGIYFRNRNMRMGSLLYS